MDFIKQLVPNFVDPLLSYIEAVLPPPVYSILLTVLSHSLALASALLSLATSPSTWNAQTILPPLITILAAYIALSSLYRTIRFTIWLVKWGTILASLFGGVGWLMSGGPLGQRGEVGDRRPGTSSSRPRAWESWDRHDTYREERRQRVPPQDGAEDVQKFVQELTGAAGRIYAQSGDWWEAAKGVVEEIGERARERAEKSSQKAKAKSRRKSGSR